MVTQEVKVEHSSDLEVGWILEQQKCDMGRPLTLPLTKECFQH